jgi:hypothetical protein
LSILKRILVFESTEPHTNRAKTIGPNSRNVISKHEIDRLIDNSISINTRRMYQMSLDTFVNIRESMALCDMWPIPLDHITNFIAYFSLNASDIILLDFEVLLLTILTRAKLSILKRILVFESAEPHTMASPHRLLKAKYLV